MIILTMSLFDIDITIFNYFGMCCNRHSLAYTVNEYGVGLS